MQKCRNVISIVSLCVPFLILPYFFGSTFLRSVDAGSLLVTNNTGASDLRALWISGSQRYSWKASGRVRKVQTLGEAAKLQEVGCAPETCSLHVGVWNHHGRSELWPSVA